MFANNSIAIHSQRGQINATAVVMTLAALILGVSIGIVSSKQDNTNNETTKNQQTSATTAENASTSNSAAAKAKGVDKDEQDQTVLTVEPVSAQVTNVPVSFSTEGTLVAAKQATVSGKVAGVAVEQILVNEGDWVNKGQALAVFDTKGLEQQLIQANASRVQAQTAFDSAQADVARIEPLLKIGAVSVLEYERYITNAKQAQAGLVAAEAALENQKIRLNNAKVIAPVSGIISEKMAKVGGIAQGPLFNIIENGILEWEAKVSSQNLSKIATGTDVVIETASANDPTQTQPIFGKVVRIKPILGNDRQAKVRVLLQRPDKQTPVVIQAGMLLTGRFVLGVQPQQIVPASALINNDGYDYLMLIENVKKKTQDKKQIHIGTINKVKVDVGERLNDAVVIKAPQLLAPSAQKLIVRQGGSFLNDGDKVRVLYSPMQASQQASAPSATSPSTASPIQSLAMQAKPEEVELQPIDADTAVDTEE